MEEILASIRKIISEDAPEPAPAQPQARPVQEAEVLELTQEIHEEPPPPPAAEPPNVSQFQPIEEAPVTSAAPAPSSSGDGLFSDRTRKALDEAFTTLDQPGEKNLAAASAAPVAPLEGRTLEAVFDKAVRGAFDPVLRDWLDHNKDSVIERMKPVITAWLDENFPSMLEQAVKGELARVARSRLGR
jgi:cell pole-organizing protein PopZ